jgi:hypothetical protein
MPKRSFLMRINENKKRAGSAGRGTAGRVPFVPDVRRGNKRFGRLFVFMPHGLQQFFAFVLSDFAAAFFSQIAHC